MLEVPSMSDKPWLACGWLTIRCFKKYGAPWVSIWGLSLIYSAGDMVYFKVLGQPFLVLGSLKRINDIILDKRSSNYSDRLIKSMLRLYAPLDPNVISEQAKLLHRTGRVTIIRTCLTGLCGEGTAVPFTNIFTRMPSIYIYPFRWNELKPCSSLSPSTSHDNAKLHASHRTVSRNHWYLIAWPLSFQHFCIDYYECHLWLTSLGIRRPLYHFG